MANTWRELVRRQQGDDYAHAFAAHFDAREAAGEDVHGEAAFVAALVAPGATILDAGCGTGRVAARLADLGYDVVGADPDENMIAVARERRPDLTWHVAGLADLDLGTAYEVVVLAGNVIPFVDPGTLLEAMRGVAAHTRGPVICGFGYDAEHLPPGAPVVPLPAYDDACAAAGLSLADRFGGWAREPFTDDGYAVSVHRLG